MTIVYKVKDIQGNISDVEIEKSKTVKDFKAEIDDVLQSEYYRRDLINIIYKQSILQDDQTIESIGAEENACFSISSTPTVKIDFDLPYMNNLSNLNLKVKDFLIGKNCTEKEKIINAICYQEPNLSPDKIKIFSNNWEPLNNPITVENGKKFGLYIQEDNLTPLIFKNENSNVRILYVFPSDKPLNSYQNDISSKFGQDQYTFTCNGKEFDFSENANNHEEFTEITVAQRKSGFCLLL